MAGALTSPTGVNKTGSDPDLAKGLAEVILTRQLPGELVVRLVAGGRVIASEQVVPAFNPSQSVTGVERLLAGDTVQVIAATHDAGTVITDGESPSLSVVWLAPG
jgi:hypothetical protein